MATKRKAKEPVLRVSFPDGATFRDIAQRGFLSQRALTEAEREAWARTLPWPIGKIANDAVVTDERLYNITQGDALAYLVRECAYSFSWLDAAAGGCPLADVTEWLATTRPPLYNPATGQQMRELDPELTAEGTTPLLAALALVSSRVSAGAWQINTRGFALRQERILHADVRLPGNA